MMETLSRLNEAQKQAVTKTEGPVMILAGAGSGKTRTLVMRISYLISKLNISPYRILALTFSNKAAKEMRERVASDVSDDTGGLQITTFHSFCARVLRSEAQYLGLSKSFVIYDQAESRSIIKTILQRHGISPKTISPYAIANFMDDIKNNGLYPGRRSDYATVDDSDEFYPFYLEYESELHRANAVDFGGLLTGTLQLFEKYPQVLKRHQDRFEYVLVDEYQDTNRAQFELVSMLAKKKRNICVVGDEDQSIYSWRGADINNILDFENYFSEVQVLKLEQNYRSPKNIIEAASCVISHNEARKGKTMWTENSCGDSISIVECSTDKHEAIHVAKEIKKMSQETRDLGGIAIFYRANSQSRLVEDQLRSMNVPYRVVGGVKFYDRKEIKDLLSYLRLVVNSKDSLSLSRVINVPGRGIGAITLRKLETEAVQNNCSLWEIIEHIVTNRSDDLDLKLGAKIKSSLEEFFTLVSEVKRLDTHGQSLPSHLYEKILHESGYWQYLKASKDYESQTRMENLEELSSAIKQYEQTVPRPTLMGFLELVALDTSEQHENQGTIKGEVSLMTVHASKGLEFNYVFIVGCEENIFPSYLSLDEGEDCAIEEERRLFYVAMTRTMKKLYIYFAQGRMLFGKMKFNGPSRFIHEIPSRFYRWNKISPDLSSTQSDFDEADFNQDTENNTGEVSYQLDRIPAPTKSTFDRGTQVRHSLYGEGKIISSEGSGEEEKVTIRFIDGSCKKFMLKFAPLEILCS